MEEEKKPLGEESSETKTKTFKKPARKSGFKGKGRGDRRPRPGNDFAFWNEYPELMNIAAKYPWMHIQGTPLEGSGVSVNLSNVAVQYYHPIPGVQDSAVSPLNLAFRQMYLDMHRKYRGIGAYQASDIAITILCIESALQLIVEAERVYGILNSYPVKTRIQPDGLLLALGYQPSFITDAKAHLADFRYNVNRLINLARRLPLPSGMNFCADHLSLNAFIYKDSKDDRAGLLAFAFRGYFRYRTTGQTGCINNAGTAKYYAFDRSYFATTDQLFNLIETVLNELLYDSDILRITSDFIACYGENNMQVLVPMEENYVVVPTYNEAILNKWHNSERVKGNLNIAYKLASASTTQLALAVTHMFAVYQENDIVYCMPTLFVGNSTANMAWDTINGILCDADYTDSDTSVGHIVDTWMSDPSIDVSCESVLWKGKVTVVHDSSNTKSCGILTLISDVVMDELVVNSVVNATVPSQYIYGYTDANLNVSYLEDGLCQFDWHPLLQAIGGGTITKIYGDVDNVSLVSEDTIGKILDAAMLSAFKVRVTFSGSGN